MSIAVKYGLYEFETELAGLSIEAVRERYREELNIDPCAEALVNCKEVVSDRYILRDGDRVEFLKSETMWASNEA